MRRLEAPDVGHVGPFLAEAGALRAHEPFWAEYVVAPVLQFEDDLRC